MGNENNKNESFREATASNENENEDMKKSKMDGKKGERIQVTLECGVRFKSEILVYPTTKTSKLLKVFCDKHNVEPNKFRLIYNGKTLGLKEDEKIEDYNIQDGAVITVVAHQTGGAVN